MTAPPRSPGDPATVAGGVLRLPRPPGIIRRFWARHPWLTDSLIAALYLVPAVIGTVHGGFTTATQGWITVVRLLVVLAAGAAILVFRRRRPWLLMWIAWAVCLVVFPFGAVDVVPMLLALYALAVYRSSKAAWLGLAGSVGVGAIASTIDVWTRVPGADPSAVASSSQSAVVMLVATLIGVTVGNRRRYVEALIARANDLMRERDQQAQLAAAVERSRIAREMHDIVSHGLTVMVTLASGSAAVAERDPARAAETMERVAETGRTALTDMRRMLGVLAERPDEAAELAPKPGTAAIPDLVETFRAAELPVRLTTVGAPIEDPNLELTVYRIVQEGLTNALRHAGRPSAVDVVIEHRGAVIEVRVTDDGSGGSVRSPDEPGDGGRGLVGMRERVALYGGAIDAGPRPGGGWQLRARLRADHETTNGSER